MNKLFGTLVLGIAALSVTSSMVSAKDKKDQGKPSVVDSGTFVVYSSGRKVASETFTIKKMADMSVNKSEVRAEGSKDVQKSELQLTPMGDLIRYEWKESGDEKGETVIAPNDQFLTQRVKAGDKTTEQPYLMPPSTAILDDYFFSHRELLLWRYLGSGCRPTSGSNSCALEKAQFGFIIPRQRASGMVTVRYIGREMVTVNGASKELSKFVFSSDYGEWVLWLDDAYKLTKIAVPGENIEVVRE